MKLYEVKPVLKTDQFATACTWADANELTKLVRILQVADEFILRFERRFHAKGTLPVKQTTAWWTIRANVHVQFCLQIESGFKVQFGAFMKGLTDF